jgi:ribosomal protein S18 acetylase RimI-like enzyme
MEKIRYATLKDSERITELFNSNKKLWGDNNIGYDVDDIKHYIKTDLDEMIVYESNKEIVGVMLAQFWTDFVHLQTLIVDRKYRNKGIGGKLMRHLNKISRKRGKNLIEIDVEVNNDGMRRFLLRRKFKRGKSFAYYSKSI